MADALTRDEEILAEINDFVLKQQAARGPQKNISFLAFTATPRNVTLERFGTIGRDQKPYPFHLYSMRQAIDEGFILDVLQNYTTYGAYYRLEKTIEGRSSVTWESWSSTGSAICVAAPHCDRPEGRDHRRAFP